MRRTSASCARAVKSGADREARLRLLGLARWAAERGASQPEALERTILPAVEAVVAYHSYLKERYQPRWRDCDAPAVPGGYLERGYLDDSGGPRARLFTTDAQAWADKFTATDDVSAGQIRRLFHAFRRLERLAALYPWKEVWPQLLSLAPLASDAAARGMKEGRDIRASHGRAGCPCSGTISRTVTTSASFRLPPPVVPQALLQTQLAGTGRARAA